MNEFESFIGILEELEFVIIADIKTLPNPIWNADLNSLANWQPSEVIE